MYLWWSIHKDLNDFKFLTLDFYKFLRKILQKHIYKIFEKRTIFLRNIYDFLTEIWVTINQGNLTDLNRFYEDIGNFSFYINNDWFL